MHRLLHGLIDYLRVQLQEGAQAGSDRWAEVRDVILFVFVEADGADEVDLDFVSDGDGAKQLRAGAAALLGDGEQRWDVVRGMRVIRRKKSVVHVQLPHGDPIGPGGPFGFKALVRRDAEESGAARTRMGYRLGPGIGDGCAIDGGERDSGVIDDSVDHHLRYLRVW